MGMPFVPSGCQGVDLVCRHFCLGRLHDVQAVEHTEYVGVHGDGVFMKNEIHHDVGHLAANSLQFHQICVSVGNATTKILQYEPPRVLWRLKSLRGLSHEVEQVFP